MLWLRVCFAVAAMGEGKELFAPKSATEIRFWCLADGGKCLKSRGI